MRRSVVIVAVVVLFASRGRADVIVSTPPVSIVSTVSVTMADVGETISTPTPHAMTNPPSLSFFTLTRTPLADNRRPPNTDVVFPEKANTFGAQNAGEVLTHEPGMVLLSQGAAGYPLNAQIRGASSQQTLVLMDGRPVEGAALGAADLSEIPLGQIDHIEIVRGGLSSLYGPNALSGVINVISKRSTYQGFPLSHVSYEGGSFSRQIYKLDFGSRQGPVDYFIFGDQQRESGFRSNSDYGRYNVGANAGLSMGGAGKILIDGGSYHNNAGLPGFVALEPNQFNNKDEKPASTPNARQVTDNSYLRTSYLVDMSEHISLAARFFGHTRETDLDDSADPTPANAASTDRREHSKGGDFQLTLPFGLLAGASFIHDQEDFEDRLAPANSFSGRTENWGLFAQDTLHWNILTLIPSGRYDKNSQFGDTANPHVQGMADLTDWLRFSASAGRSFRAPTLDETHFNPALDPEVAWTYEAGFETHESSRTFRMNYFRANVSDAIQSSSFTAANLESARRQGFEIQLDHIASDRFRDGWNYTYLENVGVPSGFDHRVALAYSPRHTVNYWAVIKLNKKWDLDPVLRYESSRFSGNDDTGTKLGSQLIMDLRVAYQWRQMELFFGIKDLFDKRYEEVAGFPLGGRTAYGGIKLRLWG